MNCVDLICDDQNDNFGESYVCPSYRKTTQHRHQAPLKVQPGETLEMHVRQKPTSQWSSYHNTCNMHV